MIMMIKVVILTAASEGPPAGLPPEAPGRPGTQPQRRLTRFLPQEAPYYVQRLHLGPGAGTPSRQLGRLEPPSRRVRAALEEARGVPHPSPTRGRPALRLIDINPAGEHVRGVCGGGGG